jgi:adenylate cyclase
MVYAFGPYRFHISSEILFRGADPIPVGRRALALLGALLSQPGAPVSKDALMQAAWPGSAVEEGNLTVQIAALRRVLGEAPGADRWIETLPRHGYRFVGPVAKLGERGSPSPLAKIEAAPSLPDRPSVAVLPLTNISGDPKEDYFSDGITEDIITELSRFSDLFVIARNSSFQYKGKSPDVREVGRELGVHYILEGSIRRSDDRVRISVQLIDAMTGTHRWAERYDRTLKDVFAVQDEVARSTAAILAAHVNKGEAERTLLKAPTGWKAYDYYIRAADSYSKYLASLDPAALDSTQRLLERSLSLDPTYSRAYATLSRTLTMVWSNPSNRDHLNSAVLERAFQLASKGVQFDPNLPQAHSQLGMVLLRLGQHEESIAEFERAVDLNPNFSDWRFAIALIYASRPKRAVKILESHMRLDPFYAPMVPCWLGFSYFVLKRYSDALSVLRASISRAANFRSCHVWLAATYARLGQLDYASFEAGQVLRIDPNYTIEGTQRRVSHFKNPEASEHLLDALRKAGLPECATKDC